MCLLQSSKLRDGKLAKYLSTHCFYSSKQRLAKLILSTLITKKHAFLSRWQGVHHVELIIRMPLACIEVCPCLTVCETHPHRKDVDM